MIGIVQGSEVTTPIEVPPRGAQEQKVKMPGKLAMFSVCAFCLVSVEHCWPQSQAPQENVIHVEVVGMHNDQGQVSCALYSSADGFPKEVRKAAAHVVAPISERIAVCEFPGRAPGTYAISVFQDENSNGKLDTNFLGVPREGVGASNDARGHMGPPKFVAAAFQFAGGRVSLKITIHYL